MIDVTDKGSHVIVEYSDDQTGASASATVLGLDIDTVEETAQEIVETHNLDNKTTDS